jgi:hypothetical protein
MNNDILGQLGETNFKQLCLRQGLLWSKPEPDRTGKDCLLEWPFAEGPTLDTRPSSKHCHIQVKATKRGSKSVRAKLSALEWLAKNHSPGFVIVPVFNAVGAIEYYAGIHIDEECGAKILKRLREASRDAKKANNAMMSFPLKSAAVLKSDSEVVEYLEQAIGTDIFLYKAKKEAWIKNSGYSDTDGIEYDMEVHASIADLANSFLSDGSFKATFSQPRRKRFGITLPEPDSLGIQGTGTVSIHPSEDQIWTLAVESVEGTEIARIRMPARTFAFPDLPIEHIQSKASNGLIEFSLKAHSSSFKFRFEKLESDDFSVELLLESVIFWERLVSHGHALRIEKENSKPLRISLNRASVQIRNAQLAWTAEAAELLTAISQTYAYCDAQLPSVKYSQIEQQRLEILSTANDLDFSCADPAFIRINCLPGEAEDVASTIGLKSMLLMTYPVKIANEVLAIALLYVVSPKIVGESVHLEVQKKVPLKGQPLPTDDPIPAYVDFYESTRAKIRPDAHALRPLVDSV